MAFGSPFKKLAQKFQDFVGKVRDKVIPTVYKIADKVATYAPNVQKFAEGFDTDLGHKIGNIAGTAGKWGGIIRDKLQPYAGPSGANFDQPQMRTDAGPQNSLPNID